MSRAVKLWRADLSSISTRVATALADPEDYRNLFPDFNLALEVEKIFKAKRDVLIRASEYPTVSAIYAECIDDL